MDRAGPTGTGTPLHPGRSTTVSSAPPSSGGGSFMVRLVYLTLQGYILCNIIWLIEISLINTNSKYTDPDLILKIRFEFLIWIIIHQKVNVFP